MNTTWLIVAIILFIIGIGLAVWAYVEYNRHRQNTTVFVGAPVHNGQLVGATLPSLPTIVWVLAGLSLLLIIAAVVMMIFAFRQPSMAAMAATTTPVVPVAV